MTPKFNRILILIFIFIILTLANQGVSLGQTTSTQAYMPLISNDPTRWIGPYGGTIVAIATDPTSPQTSYAATFGAGVFKTEDGGHTWASYSSGLRNLYIYSLAIDPSHPSTIYAGTYRNQIYKSTNGGNSWTWSGNGMQDQAIVYSIAIDPYQPSRIFASTRGVTNSDPLYYNGVVYRSTDAGQTWEIIIEDLTAIKDWAYQITVNPNHHEQVYVAFHETGVFRSSNYGDGDSWNPILNGITDWSGRSIVASPIPDFAWTLFYGTWHYDTVYKSDTNGNTWKLSNQGIAGKRVYTIALDPQNINKVYLATFDAGIIKSTDGGSSWQNGGLPGDQIYTIAVNPANTNRLLVGTEGDGLYRTDDDGTTWLRSNLGIENALITSVIVSPSDQKRLYSSLFGGGVYQSNNQGYDWKEINSGLSDLYVLGMVMDPAHPEYLYAMTTEAGLFRYNVNLGNGWTRVGAGLPLTQYNPPAYPPDHPFATLEMQEAFAYPPQEIDSNEILAATLRTMVFAPSNPNIVYMATAGSGVYRSIDGAQSWQAAGLNYQNILALAVDLVNPNLVYAATSTAGSLWVSNDGGVNWIGHSLNVSFYSLASSPVEAGVVYVGTDAGIYRYQSGSWTLLGLAGQVVSAITIDANHPDFIYAGTYQGAYYSNDGGSSWMVVDDELLHQIIESISIDPSQSNLVYFGTKLHGTFLAVINQ
jgi:photosystem II stability/assembly factor-like uncharacterized protein